MFKKITITAIIVLTIVVIKQNVSNGTTEPNSFSLPGGSAGFEPATTISDADAFAFANEYKSEYGKNENVVSGGVITREALDAILSTRDCNAITYKLCTDPSGRFAPANTVFLVLSGAKVTNDNGQMVTTEIGSSKYTSKQWCPPACMKFMIRNANGVLEPQE